MMKSVYQTFTAACRNCGLTFGQSVPTVNGAPRPGFLRTTCSSECSRSRSRSPRVDIQFRLSPFTQERVTRRVEALTLAQEMLRDFPTAGAARRPDMMLVWEKRYGWDARQAMVAFQSLFNSQLILRTAENGYILSALGRAQIS